MRILYIIQEAFLEVKNVKAEREGCNRERHAGRNRNMAKGLMKKGSRTSERLWKRWLDGQGSHVAFKSVLGLNLAQPLTSWESLGNFHDFHSSHQFLMYKGGIHNYLLRVVEGLRQPTWVDCPAWCLVHSKWSTSAGRCCSHSTCEGWPEEDGWVFLCSPDSRNYREADLFGLRRNSLAFRAVWIKSGSPGSQGVLLHCLSSCRVRPWLDCCKGFWDHLRWVVVK